LGLRRRWKWAQHLKSRVGGRSIRRFANQEGRRPIRRLRTNLPAAEESVAAEGGTSGTGNTSPAAGSVPPSRADAFSAFVFPVAAAKALPGNCVPFHGVIRQINCFKVTREFERDHSVACFLKKIAELADGIFASLCAANSSCDLFPVSHRELCGGIVAVTGGNGNREQSQYRGGSERVLRGNRSRTNALLIDAATVSEYSFFGRREA